MNLPWSNRKSLLGWLVALAVLATASQASAYTLKTLYSFCAKLNCADGQEPIGPLLMDPSGNLFGVTSFAGKGTVFELSPDDRGGWKERVLHNFCFCADGLNPLGHVIQDTAGNLYGTAMGDPENCSSSGVCGIVYELLPSEQRTKWKFKVVYRFCHDAPNCRQGAIPVSGLTYLGAASGVSYDGKSPLYVATNAGGANDGGAILELNPGEPRWRASVIHNSCCHSTPQANLFMDASGDIYGVNKLRIFELTPDIGKKHWTDVTLRKFCQPNNFVPCPKGAGAYPPMRDAGGSLLGVAGEGGNYGDHPDFNCQDLNHTGGCGVLYKLAGDGEKTKERVLYDFCSQDNCTDGAFPDPNLSMDSTGNIYGTARDGGANNCNFGCGVVFRWGRDGYHVLYNFCSESNCSDGAIPLGGVIADASGNLFGVTVTGGNNNNAGTVYELVP